MRPLTYPGTAFSRPPARHISGDLNPPTPASPSGSDPGADEAAYLEAAEWLVRFVSNEPDPEDPYAAPEMRNRGFEEWLEQSPKHRAAFAETLRVHRELRHLNGGHPIGAETIFCRMKPDQRAPQVVAMVAAIFVFVARCSPKPRRRLEAEAILIFLYSPLRRCCAARQQPCPIGTQPSGAAHSTP